jgi:hypothetical protein
MEALGGILVALVVKYADNILKTLATAVSIVSSTSIACYLFDYKVSSYFMLGSLLVMCSIYTYSNGLPTWSSVPYEEVQSDPEMTNDAHESDKEMEAIPSSIGHHSSK